MQHVSTPTRTRAGTTTAAAVIHLVLVSLAAVVTLLLLFLIGILGHSVANSSDAHNSVNGLLLVLLVVAAAFCGVGIWLGVMLLQRRDWARWTLVVLYALAALSQLVNIANRRAPGVFSLAIDIAVLVLLLHPATARDCSRVAALPAALPHPPGWYPDPHNPTAMRYWDGTRWTEHSAPRQ
jgi:hypothetical protein